MQRKRNHKHLLEITNSFRISSQFGITNSIPNFQCATRIAPLKEVSRAPFKCKIFESKILIDKIQFLFSDSHRILKVVSESRGLFSTISKCFNNRHDMHIFNFHEQILEHLKSDADVLFEYRVIRYSVGNLPPDIIGGLVYSNKMETLLIE